MLQRRSLGFLTLGPRDGQRGVHQLLMLERDVGAWWGGGQELYHFLVISTFFLLSFFFFFFFLFFLGPHLRYVFIPRLGVESEPQLPAYTTATATQDPNHIFDLPRCSQQCPVLNPHSHGY